ncbi:helix-turn-helix domain-containing protein [Nocardia sp. NPDC051463]|uniref:TetR/AcrR family transcriptional regulator n=1 Tax=Nocardia sp. NPDC051463 TaxID=3154845 RepID=UPI003450119A
MEARILEAALIQFGKGGVKKTTIEDIARQADVDRVTVYRRISSRDDVVRAVMTREMESMLAELDAISVHNNDVHTLVADIVVTVITRWHTRSPTGCWHWNRTACSPNSPPMADPRSRCRWQRQPP